MRPSPDTGVSNRPLLPCCKSTVTLEFLKPPKSISLSLSLSIDHGMLCLNQECFAVFRTQHSYTHGETGFLW